LHNRHIFIIIIYYENRTRGTQEIIKKIKHNMQQIKLSFTRVGPA